MVGLKELARLDAERRPPAWLRPLLSTPFFEECPEHRGTGRATTRSATACNLFCTRCVDVGRALCSACVAAGHPGHRVVQVRKSSYHTVVKVADVAALLDMSMVQTYMINGDRVVFLNPRPVSGQGKPAAARCRLCERGLQDVDCCFCSIGCKLDGMEGKFEVSFAVPPRSESESEETSESDDDAFRPTKFRNLGTLSGSGQSAARGKLSGEEGVGTSGKPPAAPATGPSSGQHRRRKSAPVRSPFF
ncbi:hypothetical protein ACP70R_001107 [Stipagrostis hirtigluma subsp. patula]